MKRSTDRILTTHAGCLQRPLELIAALKGEQEEDVPKSASGPLHRGVADVVRRQVETGLDIVNDGEFGKAIWHWYVFQRLTGFERRPWQEPYFKGRDRQQFPEFYDYAERSLRDAPGGPTSELFYGHDEVWLGSMLKRPVCVGPIDYRSEWIARDLDNLKAALGAVDVEEAFYPTVAPASIEVGVGNEHYDVKGDALLYALADAMKKEYEAIAAAGLIVQVDDAWVPALWDHEPDLDLAGYRKFCRTRIDALNHALADIPEERIRYHICWGSWHGPHAQDVPMKDILDLVLAVKAQAYLFEAANVRHAHEYHLWETVKLPEGKILIPGVVTHSTNLIETPELVAERIIQFAERVGRENVIAGTDCGMGARIHPELGWAKLRALAEGARMATERLWRS